MSGGDGADAAPPITRTSRFLLSLARFCDNMSFPAQRYCLACAHGAVNIRGGVEGARSPPIGKTSNRTVKRFFLLSLAKICLLRACPKKQQGGWGGAAPPICKTSNKR